MPGERKLVRDFLFKEPRKSTSLDLILQENFRAIFHRHSRAVVKEGVVTFSTPPMISHFAVSSLLWFRHICDVCDVCDENRISRYERVASSFFLSPIDYMASKKKQSSKKPRPSLNIRCLKSPGGFPADLLARINAAANAVPMDRDEFATLLLRFQMKRVEQFQKEMRDWVKEMSEGERDSELK